MPRRRVRKEPLNDPGGLETIFEETDEEDTLYTRRFVVGICARKRSLHLNDSWFPSKDKSRQRKKMIRKHIQKPLPLNPLSPGGEANLNRLLEERLSDESEEEVVKEAASVEEGGDKKRSDSLEGLIPDEILKEIEEADALCGPIPFLNESSGSKKTKQKPRKDSMVVVRRSSRFLSSAPANKENFGSVFEEREVPSEKRKRRSRSILMNPS